MPGRAALAEQRGKVHGARYFGAGSLRQLLERQSSQKNPHGPQAESVTLKAARTSINAACRAIRELPTGSYLYMKF
jgi:hypothetical protein